MRQDDRAPLHRHCTRVRVGVRPWRVRRAGELHDCREIQALAVQAGIGPGVTVLDLCCGIAGPGRFLTRSWAAPTWGWTPARAPSPSPASARPTCTAARDCADPAPPNRLLRRRAPARDDARLRGQDALVARSPRRFAGRAVRLHARGGAAAHGSRAAACPTPTRCGLTRSTRWPRPWSGPGSSFAWQRTTAARIALRAGAGGAFAADAGTSPRDRRRSLDALLAAHRL